MDFVTFVNKHHPDLYDKYLLQERIDNHPETLIGIDVIAIRSGFSCGSSGGTHMTIDQIDETFVHLVPNEKNGNGDSRGWMTRRDGLCNAVKLADPDKAAVQFWNPNGDEEINNANETFRLNSKVSVDYLIFNDLGEHHKKSYTGQ